MCPPRTRPSNSAAARSRKARCRAQTGSIIVDRQRELPGAELPQVRRRCPLRIARGIRVRRVGDRRGLAVEPAERADDAANVVGVHRAGCGSSRSSIRSAGRRRILTSQSTTVPSRPEPQPAVGVDRQRHGAEVDVAREAAVESQLLGAVVPARRLGAEIEIALADRLLELPGVTVGEEHPRHVGFDGVDAPRRLRRSSAAGRGTAPSRASAMSPFRRTCRAAHDRVVHPSVRPFRHYGAIRRDGSTRVIASRARHRRCYPGTAGGARAMASTVLTIVKVAGARKTRMR